MRKRIVPAILILINSALPIACASADKMPVKNHSFSSPEDVLVEHIHLDLEVDFKAEKIRGEAVLRIANITGRDKLVLDTRALKVANVRVDGKDAEWTLGAQQGDTGEPLIVAIGFGSREVTVKYETTDAANGLDWLKPSQTRGGKKPFLFTQGQAILNRSWIPCQDTPAVRVTYSARIRTEPGLLVVMSAGNPTEKSPDGVYEFDMPQPIPPYLIAMAIGDLEFRAISERIGVYAEPDLVERAKWEFDDTDEMMEVAEGLYGPYRWDRYDIIVLPPSFPFGGMENPRLSFVTPVLVAGDRSLTSTIAHELAHSWSGNLVTNETWGDFWLNEGFTTYFERRILELVYGREQGEMDAALGLMELESSMSRASAEATKLKVRIDGEDPDDTISTAAYEKGYLFLRLIEETVGREKFDAFLRGYFDEFAFQTMTTEGFLTYLQVHLVDDELGVEIGVDQWVYESGLPDNHPVATSQAFDHVAKQNHAFAAGTPAKQLDTDGWNTQQWKRFIQNLPPEMTIAQMEDLDAAFGFSQTTNGELAQVWFPIVVEHEYEAAYDEMETFLIDIGRIWLITPVYRKLALTPDGMELAHEIYAKARPGYHALTVSIVDQIVKWDEET